MTAARVADLQLRAHAGPLRARVHWPSATGNAPPPALLVFFPGDRPADPLVECLSQEAGLVVLSIDAPDPELAATATRWAADHGAELDADPARLLVGGIGRGVDLATGVKRLAEEDGWPPIAGVLHLGDDTEDNAALIRDLRTWLALGGGRAAS
jgi:acetyl esterase